jgi:hypothetical protein
MKFTVEIDEFYLDEEQDLAPALVKQVTTAIVNQIWGKIKEKVDKQVTVSVAAQIDAELATKINLRVAELIASEKITRDGKEISIVDYIKQRFDSNAGWNSPNDHITKIAKQFGDEMKKRYDYFYANQIVQQMHTVGIIKEEIFANLIENKK